MFCAKCGKEIGESEKFCSGCGASVEEMKNNEPAGEAGMSDLPFGENVAVKEAFSCDNCGSACSGAWCYGVCFAFG